MSGHDRGSAVERNMPVIVPANAAPTEIPQPPAVTSNSACGDMLCLRPTGEGDKRCCLLAGHAGACRFVECYDSYRGIAATLVESVALALGAVDGNEEAVSRSLRSDYDALGYRTLAKAAVCELERLGLLPGSSSPETAPWPTRKPSGDLASGPGRGVSAT